MLYKSDWEQTQKRFLEYWNRENHDRPLIHILAPKGNYKPVHPNHTSHQERWLDTEYQIKTSRAAMEATYFGAESIPMFWPNLGPDIFGATLGCDLNFEESTSYSIPFIEDWNQLQQVNFNRTNKWWQKIIEMTQAAIADSKGDYLVGLTDFHSGFDGLVSLRGPEKLAMDIYDFPDEIKEASIKTFSFFQEQLDITFDMTQKIQKGTTNWMGIWHPEKWYVTSCDFSTMISVDMYKEFILPELQLELNWLNHHSVYHLDGPGALKHLDVLLEQDMLNGIQWVYGAGQPTAAHWIPVLQKIQAAGKLIHIDVPFSDLNALLENLSPEGVMLTLPPAQSEEDVKSIINGIEKARPKKIF